MNATKTYDHKVMGAQKQKKKSKLYQLEDLTPILGRVEERSLLAQMNQSRDASSQQDRRGDQSQDSVLEARRKVGSTVGVEGALFKCNPVTVSDKLFAVFFFPVVVAMSICNALMCV